MTTPSFSGNQASMLMQNVGELLETVRTALDRAPASAEEAEALNLHLRRLTALAESRLEEARLAASAQTDSEGA